MQLSVETVVWVALVLVVVAVVGIFLMNSTIASSKQVSQKFYVRLIKSEFTRRFYRSYDGYVISLRVVNTGEKGNTITSLRFTPSGFTYTTVYIWTGSTWTSSNPYSVTINPGETTDITIAVRSDYIDAPKSLLVTAYFSDGTTATVTVQIP